MAAADLEKRMKDLSLKPARAMVRQIMLELEEKGMPISYAISATEHKWASWDSIHKNMPLDQAKKVAAAYNAIKKTPRKVAEKPASPTTPPSTPEKKLPMPVVMPVDVPALRKPPVMVKEERASEATQSVTAPPRPKASKTYVYDGLGGEARKLVKDDLYDTYKKTWTPASGCNLKDRRYITVAEMWAIDAVRINASPMAREAMKPIA